MSVRSLKQTESEELNRSPLFYEEYLMPTIAELCEQHQVSLDDLTEKTQLEKERVLAIMLGRWTPSPQERDKIAAVFNVEKEAIAWGHKTPIQHIWGY